MEKRFGRRLQSLVHTAQLEVQTLGVAESPAQAGGRVLIYWNIDRLRVRYEPLVTSWIPLIVTRRYRPTIPAFVLSEIPPSFEEFRDAEDALSALSIPEDPFEGGRKYLYIPNFVTCKAFLLRSFDQVNEVLRCAGGYGNFMQDRVLLAQLSYVANRR